MQTKSGKFGDYGWIESREVFPDSIFSVLSSELVGTTMVVATFDSGPLSPSESEVKMGWYSEKGALYAPKLLDIKSIPWDNYDEIYFYDRDPEKVEYQRFVNFGMFSLVDPMERAEAADKTWDLVGLGHDIESEIVRQNKFREQILYLHPKFVLVNGDNLILIYRDEKIGAKIKKISQIKMIKEAPPLKDTASPGGFAR